jgi:hypothetical protein
MASQPAIINRNGYPLASIISGRRAAGGRHGQNGVTASQ